MALDSGAAAGGLGTVLNAHELGHLLMGSDHIGGNNLMNGTISASHTELTADQISTIFASAWVLDDSAGAYIDIAPILVSAAVSIPLPGALILCLSVLVPLGLFGGRRYNKTI